MYRLPSPPRFVRPTARVLRCLFLLMVFATLPAAAQTPAAGAEDSGKPQKLFESDQTLEVEIEAPWRRLVRDVRNQDPYPGTLTWTDETGTEYSVPITVERRGLTRQRVCEFPPIKLRIEKDRVRGTTFRGQDSLKMVTHCDKGDRWEQYYIKEMLAYRMYNLLTDLSFRVRPLSVRYVEAEGGSSQSGRFAFVIEDDSDVAKRNGMDKLHLNEIQPEQLESREASRFALFQYMIGNVDWAVLSGPGSEECCHNAKLVGTNPDHDLVALPYDFDSSGLVDAHYAAPNEGLPIRQVTERLYRGFCVHNATLQAAREELQALEPDIHALIEAEDRLSRRSSKIMSRYLDEFFKTIKYDQSFEREIIRECRK